MMFVDGIAVIIERKKVRNLILTVKRDCSVHLSAPERISEKEIKEFLKDKSKWMKKNIEKYSEVPMEHVHDYRTGDKFVIFDEEYTLISSEAGRYSFSIRDNIIYGTFRRDSSAENRKKHMDKFLAEVLTAKIAELLPQWERVTGLKCSSWSVKPLRGKWGTCMIAEKVLTFNLNLVSKEQRCIEYIILHELTHIRYRYHDDKFKAFVTRYMPDWKDVNKRLTYSQ